MIIARRQLRLVANRTEKSIEIRVFAPEQRDGAWWCAYEIEWPQALQASAGAGIDSVQAIRITLEKIGTEIYSSEAHRSGRLVWDKAGNGYGFPVPKNIRHMLVGDDALFD